MGWGGGGGNVTKHSAVTVIGLCCPVREWPRARMWEGGIKEGRKEVGKIGEGERD